MTPLDAEGLSKERIEQIKSIFAPGPTPQVKYANNSEIVSLCDLALAQLARERAEPFQARVAPWMQECFGPEISADRLERGDRFLEESLELLQSGGYPRERVSALTAYTFDRPQGEINQEVGGVMVTLAAYCIAFGLDMHEAGETELARIWTKIDKIRAKQAAKPTGSALAVVASPPVAVRVKPLEWTYFPANLRYEGYEAITPCGRYSIPAVDGKHQLWLAMGGDTEPLEEFQTLDAAQAAAQADYDQRIRSALYLNTTPTVDEGVWRKVRELEASASIIHGKLVSETKSVNILDTVALGGALAALTAALKGEQTP